MLGLLKPGIYHSNNTKAHNLKNMTRTRKLNSLHTAPPTLFSGRRPRTGRCVALRES